MDKKSEEQFFEMYDKVQAYADRHNIPTHQVIGIREVWDYAYACGKADGAEAVLETFKESN